MTPDGQFQYLKMPFGLCNAPASFQRAMNIVLGNLVGKFLTVYINDIQVYSATFGDHLQHLQEVLTRMRRHKLFLKPKKCTFGSHEMKYLGFVLTETGLATDSTKVKDTAEFPRPTNLTELRAFLGLATYYRQFVQNFATIASPLYQLLRKDQRFEWKQPQELVFKTLKRKLTEAPILIRPNWERKFTLYTDASSLGLGAVLTQQDDEGRERVVLYASRRAGRIESHYEATKLECLAVVWAVKQLRHYLPSTS